MSFDVFLLYEFSSGNQVDGLPLALVFADWQINSGAVAASYQKWVIDNLYFKIKSFHRL